MFASASSPFLLFLLKFGIASSGCPNSMEEKGEHFPSFCAISQNPIHFQPVRNYEYVFLFQGRYFTYLSVRWSHLGWHVGIKRSGKAKKAVKTVYPSSQKAIQFLHLRPFPAPPTEEDLGRAISAAEGAAEKGPVDFPAMAYIDEEEEEASDK